MPPFDFLGLRNSVLAIRDRYLELDRQLQAVVRSASQIRGARVNREDLIEHIGSSIEAAASDFRAAVEDRFGRYFSGTTPPGGTMRLGIAARLSGANEPAMTGALDGALCALLGSQLRDFLAQRLRAMEWPEEGLPRAQREKKLEELAKKEAAIRSEMEALVLQANEAGIDLSR